VIRVLLVDDEALVRRGLRLILDSAGDIQVVAEATGGAEAVPLAARYRADVVLMDIRMRGGDGLTATRHLLALDSPPRVVVLTTFDLDEYVFGALQAGASGFLLKDTPPQELIQAVRVVAGGDAMLSPSVTRRLIAQFVSRSSARPAEARRLVQAITDRERQVLTLVGQGLSNSEISARLLTSEATVKAQVSSILAKIGASNRVQAAILAHDAGLLDR
jgi:DNA-binding NarL/FixJ family response regulator